MMCRRLSSCGGGSVLDWGGWRSSAGNREPPASESNPALITCPHCYIGASDERNIRARSTRNMGISDERYHGYRKN